MHAEAFFIKFGQVSSTYMHLQYVYKNRSLRILIGRYQFLAKLVLTERTKLPGLLGCYMTESS